MQHLVLVGAGHAHVEVLRAFGRRPEPGLRITVITREPASPYSGMLPGVVAGRYARAEAEIDISRLARFAGAELIIDEVTGLDPKRHLVMRHHGDAIGYDIVSLDIGSRPNTNGIPGAPDHTIPVKPIGAFLAKFEALRARLVASQSTRIALVGGGAGGVELILAIEQRLREPGGPNLSFTLVTGGTDILPGFPHVFRQRALRALANRRIAVRCNAKVIAVAQGTLTFENGPHLEADEILWTTEASAPSWLANTGLTLDDRGFVTVDATLQAQDGVFAAGDVISFRPRPLPRSGVSAVRAGPVLAENLRAALRGKPLQQWKPQRNWLVILSTADGSAIATRNGFTVSGRWVSSWKERIDRRFMLRFKYPDHAP